MMGMSPFLGRNTSRQCCRCVHPYQVKSRINKEVLLTGGGGVDHPGGSALSHCQSPFSQPEYLIRRPGFHRRFHEEAKEEVSGNGAELREGWDLSLKWVEDTTERSVGRPGLSGSERQTSPRARHRAERIHKRFHSCIPRMEASGPRKFSHVPPSFPFLFYFSHVPSHSPHMFPIGCQRHSCPHFPSGRSAASVGSCVRGCTRAVRGPRGYKGS